MANRATATIAVIVAKDRVTAEQGILVEVCFRLQENKIFVCTNTAKL